MGQKFNYLVDPVKSVKTGRLQVAPGELKGLLTFLPFLKIEQYYKNSVSNREENLEAKNCPFKKPANLVSPAKRKTKRPHINIVQVLVPPSSLNKSKCKHFNELQKNWRIIRKHYHYDYQTYSFIFSERLKVSKKGINNQCAMEQYLTKRYTLYSRIKNAIKLTSKVLS